jgi:serine/threonine protein phosphatase PrpC
VRIAHYARASDPGRRRRRNEDAYVVAPPLFAVADGMGGAQAGEVASKLAAAALEDTDTGKIRGEQRIASLIQEANRRVYERSNADPATSGMGTTMTVALIEGGIVAIGHVGDSRAYLVRDGRIEQLTDDHSLVNELLKSGRLSPEEAEVHPQRSVITRAVGTDPDVDVDTFSLEAKDGDVFLLCSDGLTDMVSDAGILEVIQRHRDDLAQVTNALVREANRGGGEDNITVVAFEVAAGGDEVTETIAMPAQAPALEDEDTLSGLDTVPTLETVIVPPEQVAELVAAAAASNARPVGTEAVARAARIRLAVTMGILVAVAVALIAWGLLH